jgi:hypothetical protein
LMAPPGSLGTQPRNYSPRLCSLRLPASVTPLVRTPFGDRHLYVSCNSSRLKTSTRDEMAANLPLMREKSVHRRSRHLYASVIGVECGPSTRDEKAAKPPLMREKSMHLRSRSLYIFLSAHRKRRCIMHRDHRDHSPHHLAWPTLVPAPGQKWLTSMYSPPIEMITSGVSLP